MYCSNLEEKRNVGFAIAVSRSSQCKNIKIKNQDFIYTVNKKKKDQINFLSALISVNNVF